MRIPLSHLILGGGLPTNDTKLPCTDTSVFRLNPLTQHAGSITTVWRCLDRFTLRAFKQLVDLDMAAIKNMKKLRLLCVYASHG